MSSEVETSLDISGFRNTKRFLHFGRNDKEQDTTRQLFASLAVFQDIDSRSAAMNMAIDETLLETAPEPAIRFYRWDHPALSFGYFGKFADVANHQTDRDMVRRWTGGGIVFHGGDLTYSILIPANDPAFGESSMSIYEKIHIALRTALAMNGQTYELAGNAAPKISESCFRNPVRADVLSNGRKVAGAAQRRTRRGLLQQGSIQDVDLAVDFQETFASKLSDNRREQTISQCILQRAKEIADQKYAALAWLRRR